MYRLITIDMLIEDVRPEPKLMVPSQEPSNERFITMLNPRYGQPKNRFRYPVKIDPVRVIIAGIEQD